MAWYPVNPGMYHSITQQPEEVHDVANKRALNLYFLESLGCLKYGIYR